MAPRPSGTLARVSDAPPVAYDVLCPHCKRPFRSELLIGSTPRHTGFKCPHCRLFVPYERAGELATAEAADPA